jgi:3-hydroxybutyrate dehydrogenase
MGFMGLGRQSIIDAIKSFLTKNPHTIMLKGKRALVTGSTSGIGLGIACALAQEGMHVMLNGFGDPAPALAAVKAASGAHAAKVVHHGADMCKPADIAAMMQAAEQAFGGVDVLVNNAGIQHVDDVQDFPIERWDAVIAINLTSAFHTTRLAVPGMKQRGYGRVINVASAHGLVASARKSAYVAAKHGLVGFTKSVALELATTPVTVNAICPGWVLTPLVQKQVDARAAADGVDNAEASRRLLGDKQPSMQFTTPEQLGALAVFMCMPAADNVRGVAWNVDGGWTAQ